MPKAHPESNKARLANALDPSSISRMDIVELRKLQSLVVDQIQKVSIKETKCENCGLVFTTKRAWQRFCCKKCRNDYFWKTHEVKKKVQVFE
jgi:protein-arginine kinase activator protein McsA